MEIRHKTAELLIVDYLTSKHSDFIIASLGTALVERSKGVPLVNVCQLGKESMVMLITAAGNGLETLADLSRPTPSGKPRRFAVFQVCLQNNQRQKQQKQKRVKSRKVLLIVKAAAKLCCRRRSLYSTKTRNQGRVVFPSEISTLPLTPHFCSETLSIMLRE